MTASSIRGMHVDAHDVEKEVPNLVDSAKRRLRGGVASFQGFEFVQWGTLQSRRQRRHEAPQRGFVFSSSQRLLAFICSLMTFDVLTK